ncbi:hypothetical protein ACN9ML_11815 [Dyadobacter endophyticus]|uniref:hypothetical protein n=1 Tax=Dyadobacter endophyticus TaxID=1749036 RepID=UPI003CF08171
MKKLYVLLLMVCAWTGAYSQGSGVHSTSQVHPGGHYGVYGSLLFNSGYLVTPRSSPTNNVYFTDGSAYSGASDGSHIDGYAEKAGNTAFTFPIGNGAKLRTAGISAPATAANFKAAYWFENPNAATLPAGAPFPVSNLGTGVSAVSSLEYWDVDGASSVNLTLTWDAASNLSVLTSGTIANLVVVGYNTTTAKWESLGNAGGTTGALATTGTITANGVTPDNYAAFTFGTSAAATTPDLRPFTIMPNVTFSTTETVRPFTVRLRNMRTGTVASDLITVRVYKPTPSSVIALTGASAAEWTITNSGTYYTLTTNTDIPASPLGNSITATVSIASATPSGTYPLRVFIPDLSGGEVVADNVNNNLIIQVFKNM